MLPDEFQMFFIPLQLPEIFSNKLTDLEGNENMTYITQYMIGLINVFKTHLRTSLRAEQNFQNTCSLYILPSTIIDNKCQLEQKNFARHFLQNIQMKSFYNLTPFTNEALLSDLCMTSILVKSAFTLLFQKSPVGHTST